MPSLLRAAVLPLCLAAGPAVSQDLFTHADPTKILEIARGFGSAELGTANSGAPRLTGRIEGVPYSVAFLNCDDDNANCATLNFYTFFDAPLDALVALNAWNRDVRFGKAYIDSEGDLIVEMDMNLWGGVTHKNIDDTFDWWRLVLRRALEDLAPSPFAPSLDDGNALGRTL